MIYIVGIGPGSMDMMTLQARDALLKSDVIVGYTVYVDLVAETFAGKEFVTTPMKQEIERCRLCFEYEKQGKTVSLICSGDAGVYGMAAPMYELLGEYPGADIVVIPGMTAAITGASILGAPVNHDFCVISLSDLLTPWATIEKRLKAAVEGDFAMAIYNPSSHKRGDYLSKACQIMLEAGAKSDRACGYVRNIGREGQSATVCTLSQLMNTQVDMFTTVFIGNSQSQIINGKLVTKRGYVI